MAAALDAAPRPDATATCKARGRDDRGIDRGGIAIMMVVDTSGSMRARDVGTGHDARTRLDEVEDLLIAFVCGNGDVPGRPDDAIGLVSFAADAYTLAPSTLDHDALLQLAKTLAREADRTESGSAMGDGLALAILRLRQAETTSKVAILFTDGANDTGVTTPLEAAEFARADGIKVYAVGVGATAPAPGVRAQVDEATLRQIADRTGGKYFRATDADTLRHVYDELDRLERN